MKKYLFIAIFFLGAIFTTQAQTNSNHTYVNGYTKSNGTYVSGYYRTAPNSTINDNFSTYPNVNPYTGNVGTISPTVPVYNSTPTRSSTYYNNSTYINTKSIYNTDPYKINTSSYYR